MIPIVGQWPGSGNAFILFECREPIARGDHRHEPALVCWTPTPQQWLTLGQVLAGLSSLDALPPEAEP